VLAAEVNDEVDASVPLNLHGVSEAFSLQEPDLASGILNGLVYLKR